MRRKKSESWISTEAWILQTPAMTGIPGAG